MSARIKAWLELAGLIFAVVMSAFSGIGYLALIPHRLDAQESYSKEIKEDLTKRNAVVDQRFEELFKSRNTDKELLTRIDERTAYIQKQLERLQQQKP